MGTAVEIFTNMWYTKTYKLKTDWIKYGAARTSAYYAISPFIGALISLIIFKDIPEYSFVVAMIFMAAGAWLCSADKPIFTFKREKGK